jgi:UDPglucose 6-dehydrogenase
MKINNICCIGAGYVGGPTMTVLADKCPNLKVNVVDTNKKRIALWNNKDLSKLPIYEPGLSEIIGRARGKNLFFTSDVDESLKNADMVFISVNTPIKKKGIGAGQACDLRWVEASARQIARCCKGKTIVVEKRTLPVKTAEVIAEILISTSEKEKGKEFYVLSNPEFLAEGSAVENLLNPDRVLIGGDHQNAIQILKEIYLNCILIITTY